MADDEMKLDFTTPPGRDVEFTLIPAGGAKEIPVEAEILDAERGLVELTIPGPLPPGKYLLTGRVIDDRGGISSDFVLNVKEKKIDERSDEPSEVPGGDLQVEEGAEGHPLPDPPSGA